MQQKCILPLAKIMDFCVLPKIMPGLFPCRPQLASMPCTENLLLAPKLYMENLLLAFMPCMENLLLAHKPCTENFLLSSMPCMYEPLVRTYLFRWRGPDSIRTG